MKISQLFSKKFININLFKIFVIAVLTAMLAIFIPQGVFSAITKPTLNSPANNATITSTSCTFSWSHPYNDKYELKIKTKGGTLKYASGKISAKSITVDLSGKLTIGSTYKWYVVVYANGEETSSDDRWFTYNPPTITKPTLQAPANNVTITDASCTFSWSHPYNDQYELKIKTEGGTLKYASGRISAKSMTVDLAGIPLTAGSSYKWYVVVYANGLEDSSEDRWFTYNYRPITKPTLQAPANNVTITDASCAFSWSHPYNDQYELKIKTEGGTLKYASGRSSAKSMTVDLAGIPLTAGSTYKWYVVVYANGLEDSSEDRWFTYNYRPITKPTLQAPANNVTITDASCAFSWSHPYNDQYELKIKDQSGVFRYQSGKISGKSISVNLAAIPLTAGSTYKWYVVVYANGLEDSSEDRWFTYNYRPITKPTLDAPGSNASITDASCTFSWSHPYNDQYELKIKDQSGAFKYQSGKISAKSLSVNLAAIPLTAGSTYKWYVVVYANGLEDSSEDRWFTYNYRPITKPTLDAPANNASIADASCTFSWSHPYNDQYELKIKTGGGTLKYASGRISAKSITVDLSSIPLTAGSNYKWYVVVYANGLEDSSEDRWFTYNFNITPIGHCSVSGGSISPNPVFLGQDFHISFTLKEVRGTAKSFEDVAVAILNPSGNFVFDFVTCGSVTIPANGTYSKTAKNHLLDTNPTGPYKAIVRGKLGGLWFDFDTTGSGVNPMQFTVKDPPFYALCIGLKSDLVIRGVTLIKDFYRADLGAFTMSEKFAKLTDPKNVRWVPGDISTGGLSKSKIKDEINEFKWKLKDGDTFILYIHSHGGTFKPETVKGTESTISPEDEFVSIGPSHEGTPYPDGALSDNELVSYLQGMDNINKWIILDSCRSAGFWGNNDPDDAGDLEKLQKIGLLAACGETEATQFEGSGWGVFTEGLSYAFSLNEKGKLNADLNQDGKLDFNELYTYMHQCWPETDRFKNGFVGKILYEAEFGDAVTFTKEMWNPGFATAGTINGIKPNKRNNIVPIINLLLLFGAENELPSPPPPGGR